MKRLLAILLILTFISSCAMYTAAESVDPTSPAELDAVSDIETVDVDILFIDTDNGTEKRELLKKLLAESDSALLRACPAVDDLNELESDLFGSINEYNQYSDVFRESRRLYFEDFNQKQYQALIREYAIAPTLIYASRYTPSIQLRITKADLMKIQYDESIAAIARFEDQPTAVDEEAVEDAESLFEDQYQAFVTEAEADSMDYKELWYHRDEKGDIDWALIEAEWICSVCCVIYSDVVGGRRLWAPGWKQQPFTFDIGLYDVKQNRFYDLTDIDFDDYDGLYEVFRSLDLGNRTDPEHWDACFPLGDVDSDYTVTIRDATRIQRVLAGLESKYGIVTAEADTDGDGVMTILDATRIQRSIAGL